MTRPTKYTHELAIQICEHIVTGKSLRAICREVEGMPSASTVFLWLAKHPEFADEYALAKEGMAESVFWDVLDIADDSSNDSYLDGENKLHTNQANIARAKLRIDTRKWVLARMAPRKYGHEKIKEAPKQRRHPSTMNDKEIVQELNEIYNNAYSRMRLAQAKEELAKSKLNSEGLEIPDDAADDLC